MALKTLSTSGISNGNVILPGQVTQSVDAFTGTEGYAITLSGSFTFTGATTGSGYFSNSVSASYSLTSSYASSASVSNTSLSTSGNTSYYVPSGSLTAVAGILKMFAGAGKTSTLPPYQAVVNISPLDLTGKTLNQNLFIGLAASQSAQVVTVLTSNNTSITFESAAPGGVDFTFIGTYI